MKKQYPDAKLDMTPMIDVVFQLIIFFITTVDMESKALETKVRMAMSPHGPVEEMKDPRTVTVDVEQNGTIRIGGTRLTEGQLLTIMAKAVASSGQSTPVVIRGDFASTHEQIKRVMDICGKAGLWKLRFAAVKEKNT
ncbi:MAG: biopolymer transporter ExbD [Verrucomicrobiota bacterium]|jgi:biopolymer transport protein ExbD|nr:biopolymer transporter ExbD [Verrucomicrobiota bacterium]